MKDKHWDSVCAAQPLHALMLAATTVFLVLILMSLPFIAPGSETYYIVLLNLAIVFILLIVVGYVVRFCRRRRQ